MGRIKSIQLPAYTRSNDMLVWGAEPSGVYPTYSSYCFLEKRLDDHRSLSYWNSGKLCCPENIKFFIWLMPHEALPTNNLKSSRDLSQNSCCVICHSRQEIVLHCLRYWDFSWRLWSFFGFHNSPNFWFCQLFQS